MQLLYHLKLRTHELSQAVAGILNLNGQEHNNEQQQERRQTHTGKDGQRSPHSLNDAMDNHLHFVPTVTANQLVKLVRREDDESLCTWFVGIGTAEERSTGTQCTIS